MAWSPFQRSNAGITWVQYPGDYANKIPTIPATTPAALRRGFLSEINAHCELRTATLSDGQIGVTRGRIPLSARRSRTAGLKAARPERALDGQPLPERPWRAPQRRRTDRRSGR